MATEEADAEMDAEAPLKMEETTKTNFKIEIISKEEMNQRKS